MSPTSRTFPAKLLLFGEYTVLSGSQALAVPLTCWSGSWQFDPKAPQEEVFYKAYLQWLEAAGRITTTLKDKIITDIREGWHYRSDIPIGYGLGSSGAFVAALYYRYLHHGNQPDEKAQDILAAMEGYFHGTSSGMDPMVSYTRKAIVRDDQGQYRMLDDRGWPEGFRVYLLDSGSDRSTAPLVSQYREMLQEEAWAQRIRRELIPMVEHAIHFYLSGEGEMLEQCLAVICMFQRQHFDFLIPEDVQSQWDALVSKPGVYVKLCGAGGGGFFLVVQIHQQDELSWPGIIRIQ